jgi:uncharacterized protein YegP (UPF0339 family)
MEASEGKVRFYRDEEGKHRWRAVADNGELVADSGEGYERHAGAANGFEVLRRICANPTFVDDEEMSEHDG